MDQEPEVVEVLKEIISVDSDEDRRAVEAVALKPYDSGLHEGDPDEQPEQQEAQP